MANPNLPINYQKNTYIGARYVPKFADPTEWNNTKTYEPLTIVSYQGNSYTSKTFVPVGIDILNDTYWANTGNYNAQVEQYRQDIKNYYENTQEQINNYYNNVTAQIDKLKGQAGIFSKYKIIMIGDSYTDDNEAYPSFSTLLKQSWSAATIDLRHEGGAGFVHRGNAGHNYQELMEQQSSIPSNEVTHVVFLGGYNDYGQNGIQDAVRTAVKKAMVRYPNAKVMVGMVGNYLGDENNNRAYQLLFVHMGYQRGCSEAGGYYLDGLQYVLAWKDLMQGDGIHPNANGAKTLAFHVEQAIMTGSCYPYRIVIINLNNESSIPYRGEIYMTQYCGYVHYSTVTGITGAYPTERLDNGNFKLFDLPNYCGIYSPANSVVTVNNIYDSGGRTKQEIGNISIFHGKTLSYTPSNFNSTPSGWTEPVSNFKVGGFSISRGVFQ